MRGGSKLMVGYGGLSGTVRWGKVGWVRTPSSVFGTGQ